MQSSGHHRHSTTGASSSSGGNSSSTSTTNTRHLNNHRHVQSQVSVANTNERLEQLFDEQDHKRCSEGNRKALMAETLDHLRGLTKVLEADDWKYQSNNNNSSSGGFAWSSASRIQSPAGNGTNST